MYKKVFLEFAQKEGSQHIASENALKGIEKIILNKSIKTVFEFGIGIGTIPALLNSLNKKIIYYGTESNVFCKDALLKNLVNLNNGFEYNQLNSYEEFKESLKFDFIIIDGSFDNLKFLKSIVHDKTIIMIEGDRKSQREFIKEAFPNSMLSFVISNKKNDLNSPFYSEVNNGYVGGYSIFRIDKSLKSKMDWFREKVSTSVKYRLRRFK